MDNKFKVLNEIYGRLIASYYKNFGSYDPHLKTAYQNATYAMLRRAFSLLEGVYLLISKDLIAESAILARSLVELNWKYLFLANAKCISKDELRYEDNPSEDSFEFKRSARFLSWHWVEAHRGGNRSEKVLKMYQELKDTFGYETDVEVPKEWYHEKENKINTILDVAKSVGAEEQYGQDYRHLSGIEHSDITSIIVESYESKEESLYSVFVFFKSLQIVGSMMEMTIRISKKMDEEILNIVKEINAVSNDLYEEIWKDENLADIS
ncbi:MAG: DUF5677 domain-containing protein [Thermodesulfobacteriota bacterium]|jgi:hypothetical protein